QRLLLLCLRLTGESGFECLPESFVVACALPPEEPGCEEARGLDERRVVQQGERLLRRVAHDPLRRAFVTGRGVEIREHGMQEGALPVDVETTSRLLGA